MYIRSLCIFTAVVWVLHPAAHSMELSLSEDQISRVNGVLAKIIKLSPVEASDSTDTETPIRTSSPYAQIPENHDISFSDISRQESSTDMDCQFPLYKYRDMSSEACRNYLFNAIKNKQYDGADQIICFATEAGLDIHSSDWHYSTNCRFFKDQACTWLKELTHQEEWDQDAADYLVKLAQGDNKGWRNPLIGGEFYGTKFYCEGRSQDEMKDFAYALFADVMLDHAEFVIGEDNVFTEDGIYFEAPLTRNTMNLITLVGGNKKELIEYLNSNMALEDH